VSKTSAPASYSSLSIQQWGARAHPPFDGSFSSPRELDPDSPGWYKKEVEGCERQGERTNSPSELGSKVVARPADSSILCHCPFCHNITLQHYRLPSVRANVTKRSGEESCETLHPRARRVAAR
jgi:hypothetical protein